MIPLSVLLTGKKRAEKRKKILIRTTMLFLVCVCFMFIAAWPNNIALGEIREPKTITVSQGDTLWSITRRHAPKGLDTRDYLHQVFKANQLTSPVIHPGQRLILP